MSRPQKKNEILECQGGHLRQFHSKILAYSLFFMSFNALNTKKFKILENNIKINKNSQYINFVGNIIKKVTYVTVRNVLRVSKLYKWS